jgi:ribonucleotide reductase alpha subunit
MNKQSSAICVQKEKFFTKEQVEEETKKYFNGDDLACDTWIKKYALKDTSGLFLELTPEDMHVRMAKEFARIEETYIEKEMTCDKDKLSVYGKIRQPVLSEETIFSLFDRFRFIIPQGSVMAILGNRNTVGSLSNCIVLPQPYDSYGGICYTDQQLAQLYKRRCGCGVDISTLRPDGVKVTNAAGTSTGAVSFMERFSNTTREVGQKGRRGALMISIDIRHPDIFKFITAKEDLTKITGANISVKINDEFMIAVKEGKSFTLKFPVDSPTPTIHTEVDARTLWDEICRQATECAEPGIMFWDRHHYYSTSSIYPQYKNITTNPCFTGDTEVAVADGRNRVRFDVLASQGVDIPVYCVNDNGKVCIRMMRKPRMTRSNQKIYAVKLDDGSIIKCTEDHKFYLSDGSKVECKNLKTDDSLMISSKWQTTLNECLYGNEEHKNAKPYWMINNRKNNHLEHRFIYEQMSNDKLNNSFVIHHKDHNGLNNNFLNLEKLLKEEHNKQISDKINQLNIPVNHKVVSVEFYGIEDVYCGTVDEFHNFGIAFNSGKTKSGRERFDIAYVSNCAEIAMSAGDSCRLICVNLYSFITNPFTKEATLDEELLYRTCYEAQRIGDDLVDLELECIERILKKIDSDTEPEYIKLVEKSTWQLLKNNGKNGRRTGVGITGLADMLAAVGIRYDSKESLNFVENVMKLKCQAEFDSSIDMSITRGCFTGFDTKFEDLSHFVKMMQIEMPEIYSRMMKYGRRNISVSTAAPTGSVSIETQTSSGCEPVYELEYTRRKKINIGDTTIPDEVDESGDSWKNFKVVHPKYSIWISNNPDKKPEESPYYNSTAYSINWMKRIEMQAILQKYITHSISSTINLPAETDVETVKQIYMYGWEKGLKGLTIYRQGSRQGILISKTEKKKKNIDEIEDVHAPRRPDTLECEIHYSTIGGQQWIFLVGLLKDRPYEIFGGERTTIHIPTKYKTGWIKRNGHDERGGRIYDLIIGDINNEEEQFIYRHIQTNFSAIKGSYTRLISLQLRHGVPIKFIHDQLLKTNESDMMSFERGVSRVLKKYIGDGEKSCSRCPECKSKSLIYEEKCFKCVSCGFTGCY